MKKLIKTLLVMMLFVPCMLGLAACGGEAPAPAWDGETKNTAWYGDGSAESFEIKNGDDLAGFAKLVNEGTTFEGKTVTLSNNINLNDKEWTPIGYGSRNDTTLVAFKGLFDGKNYTIDNLSINYAPKASSKFNLGLFGNIEDATIKNVKVDVDITANENADGAGGIAGHARGQILIDNCVIGGEISAKDGVGGILGRAYCDTKTGVTDDKTLTISNCTNNASVTAKVKAAGILAATSCAVSTEGPFYKTITFTNCVNNGTISSETENQNLTGVKWYEGGEWVEVGERIPTGAMLSYLSLPAKDGYSITFTNCKNTSDSVKGKPCASMTFNYGFIEITNTGYVDVK